MQRLSRITEGFKREFALLQGTGCRWRKCSFCDYHSDTSPDPFETNREVLEKVTGEFKVLDIINSGSCVELDGKTVSLIRETVIGKGIEELWFESHWIYRDRLGAFASQFPCSVKFRCGVETFDEHIREDLWKKGIPKGTTPEEIAAHFSGICLLTGIEGQTIGELERDVETALAHFEYFSLNVFCPNTTGARPDPALAKYVRDVVAPRLKDHPKAEVLVENTDLGVG